MKNLAELFAALRQPHQAKEAADTALDTCISCAADLRDDDLYRRARVCPSCRFHYTLGARERVALLADPGTFKESHRALISIDPISFARTYKRRLFEEERRTGLADAIITGMARMAGREVELAVIDFRFLGGSIGSVVGEKLTSAMEGAARHKRPLVVVIASGGARMQEGPLALLQTAKLTFARRRMTAARVPMVCVLSNPTLGAAYTAIGALGDYTIGEPGSLIAYAAARAAGGTPDEQSVEALMRHGLLDEVVDRERLRELLIHVLNLLTARSRVPEEEREASGTDEPADGDESAGAEPEQAWNHVTLARAQGRPTALDFIARIAETYVEVRGDGAGSDTHAVTAGIAWLGGEAVLIVGQQRTGSSADPHRDTYLPPEGFRKAARAFRLAARFGLPIITLVDTPGADPRPAATLAGLGPALAGCAASLAEADVPTIAVITGEGGSEAAVAFGIADRVLMLEHATYSVVSPERAAQLLHRDPARADEVADALHLTAEACKELQVIDAIVGEPEGGAHTDQEGAARRLRTALLRTLAELQEIPPKKRARERYRRYRAIGEYNGYIGTTLVHEAYELRSAISRRAGAAAARIRHPRRQAAEPGSADEADALAIP